MPTAALGVFLLGYYIGAARATSKFDSHLTRVLSALDSTLSNVFTEFRNSLNVRPPSIPDELKQFGNAPPPPEVMAKMDQVTELSREIADMAISLEGPLRGSLDAKNRRMVAGQIKQKQEEVQSLMREVVASGFDPKVMMIDQYGNKSAKKLSEIINFIADGPEQLKAFDDDNLPNLGLVTDEDDEPVKH